MAQDFIQYSTLTSGTVTAQDSKQDVIIVHEAASLAASLTVVMPPNPTNGQRVMLLSRLGVTALTMSSALTVIGGMTTIAAAGHGTWFFCAQSNKWFRCE